MRPPSRLAPMSRRRDDRGDVKILFAGLVPALLLVVGLVVDGGGILQARMDAQWAAEQAARAGAQEISGNGYLTGGATGAHVERAGRIALEHLAVAGMRGTARRDGPDALRVDATTTYRSIFLPMVEVECDGSATVVLARE